MFILGTPAVLCLALRSYSAQLLLGAAALALALALVPAGAPRGAPPARRARRVPREGAMVLLTRAMSEPFRFKLAPRFFGGGRAHSSRLLAGPTHRLTDKGGGERKKATTEGQKKRSRTVDRGSKKSEKKETKKRKKNRMAVCA